MCTREVAIDYLRLLLKGADLESTSEEDLHEQLQTHFRQSMEPYRGQIQEEIEKFVMAAAQSQASLSAKRDRENLEPEVHVAKTAKTETVTHKHGRPCFLLSQQGLLYCTVKEFRGKLYVDIRSHYEKDGGMVPTRKGAMLPVSQWHGLVAAFPGINSAVQRNDLTHEVQLSGRRITLSNFRKDTITVDIREWYEKDGELKPGSKGIALTPPAFQALQQHAANITAALPATTASSAAAGAATASAAVSAQPPPSAAGSDPAAAVALKAGVETSTSSSGDKLWLLGNAGSTGGKFASVGTFKGKAMVGLREYFDKAGSWAPTKKGISLEFEQFIVLASHAKAISAAVDGIDTSFDIGITSTRRVTIREFKGRRYVNVREHFKKDGQLQPGVKGIALDVDQWRSLSEALPEIQATLSAL